MKDFIAGMLAVLILLPLFVAAVPFIIVGSIYRVALFGRIK